MRIPNYLSILRAKINVNLKNIALFLLFIVFFNINSYALTNYSLNHFADSIANLPLHSADSIVSAETILAQKLEKLKKAEYGGNLEEKAIAKSEVGLAYDLLDQDKLALEYLQSALRLFKQLKDSIGISKALNNIGVIYDDLGDYDEALSYYLRSLETKGDLHDPESELTLYNNIGLIYTSNGLPQKALEALRMSYQIGEEYQLEQSITFPLHNLGDVYLNLGQYDSALYYYLQSYKVDKAYDDNTGLAINLQSMGKVYLELDDFQEAKSHLEEALDIQNQLQDKHEQTNSMILLGKLYLQKKQYAEAKKYASKALAYAKSSSSKKQIKEAAHVMADISKAQSQYEKALLYTDLSNAYKDSIFNEYKSKQLILLELNKKELENVALVSDNEFKAAVMDDQQVLIEKQTYAVIFVSLGLVLSFIAVSVLLNANKDKNIANRRLIQQKQEIEEIIKELTFLNESINQQKDELQQSNQIKDKLLSIISHDFRSPLNSLEGILDLMTQGRISPQEMQVISKELRVKVNITTSLLDNLLNWAKSQMQGISPQPTFFDIKELVNDTVHLLSTQAEKKDIYIMDRVGDSQEVYADYEMTKLVVRNLLTNAIKFTTAGGKVIVKATRLNNMLKLVVKDTGKGMSENELNNLFTHQTKSTLGTAYEKGTGLGLILCKDFVEKNGGKIAVESEEGEGSTFCFTIPLYRDASDKTIYVDNEGSELVGK